VSNKRKRGSDSAPAAGSLYELGMSRPHGRTGNVSFNTSLPPALKDDLVDYCEQNGVTIVDTIEAALWLFLSTPSAEQRRWYGR